MNSSDSSTSAALLAASDTGSARPKDVWSRSGSKYRIRAIVLLGVNVLLFAGVGSFAFWLRSGVRFAPGQAGYWDELRQMFGSVGIMGRTDASLGWLLLKPISVQDVPMQIPILGLLMAALISIPILVAILYRFWSSVPFIGVVGFLAVMPWLAITLLGSCILASVKPFRTRFRFMSALIGLVPAVVYLILAGAGTADAVSGRIDPVDQIKFVAPWVLAIVAATLAFAVVLLIARVVDYRPGAIAPLLAVMFGLPVALFEFRVGRDELYYRTLQAMHSAHFADVDASVDLEEAVAKEWSRRLPAHLKIEGLRERVEMRWLLALTSDLSPDRSLIARHQAEFVARCDWFLRYFPDSRYAPNALYLRARALDTRIDPAEFRRTQWIRFYSEFPSPASRRTWRMLYENQPDTRLGALALLRLAQLEARDGDVDRAIQKLALMIGRVDPPSRTQTEAFSPDGTLSSVLSPDAPESIVVDVSWRRVLLEAHRLHDLLTANRDPLYGYDPISGPKHADASFSFGLLDLEPRDDRYADNLRILKDRYPNCQIQDNLDLEIAKATEPLGARIERLRVCLETFPEGDAVPEALFRLAMAYRATQGARRSAELFERLFNEYPESIWSRQAARYPPPRTAIRLSRAGL